MKKSKIETAFAPKWSSILSFFSCLTLLLVISCDLAEPPEPASVDPGVEVNVEVEVATSSPEENPCIIETPLRGSSYIEFTVTYFDAEDTDGDGRLWEQWGEKQRFDADHTKKDFPIKVPSKGGYVVEVKYKGDCHICCEELCQSESVETGEPEYRGKSNPIMDGASPPPIPLDFDECDCCT